MADTFKFAYLNSRFSSKFTIDNILRKGGGGGGGGGIDAEIPPPSKCRSKCEQEVVCTTNIIHPDVIAERGEEEMKEKRNNNLSPRYLQTENWLFRNHFPRGSDEAKERKTIKSSCDEFDRVPSPPPTKTCWSSPINKLCRKPMESWYFEKMNSIPGVQQVTGGRPSYFHRKELYEKKEQDRFPQWKYSYPRELEGYHPKYSRLSRFKDFYLLPPTEHDGNTRKPGQVRFSHTQSTELERVFNNQKYILPQERKPLARTLGLSERQVKTWFQNRRAKWRRIKLEDEMRTQLSKTCLPQLDEHITEKSMDDNLPTDIIKDGGGRDGE